MCYIYINNISISNIGSDFMLIFFLLLIIDGLFFLSIDFKKFNKEYLSKNNTAIIKGIFIIIVFFNHINEYVEYGSFFDKPIIKFVLVLGQLMVTLFLFYSGYGIYESIKKNKDKYISSMPKKRIFKTFFEFSLVILTFAVMNSILKIHFSKSTFLLSFIGLESIGNSNWYIFAILCLYSICYVSFKIFKKNDFMAILGVMFLTFIYIYYIERFRAPHWVDTSLCFTAGLFYSYFKDKIEKIVQRSNKTYYMFITITFLVFVFLFFYRSNGVVIFNIVSIIFCFLVILMTMKISIKSKFLLWFGNNLFWVYILQRIPMTVFDKLGLASYNKDIYFIICLLSTIALALIYSKVVPVIEQRTLFKIKK